MDSLTKKRGESETHLRLKRLALVWAQTNGYSACAVEVTLPRCRYRADLAAFKPGRSGGTCAVFECKQSLVDLRRDNRSGLSTRRQLEMVHRRRDTLERNLRVHYPALRIPDSLFAEFDPVRFGKDQSSRLWPGPAPNAHVAKSSLRLHEIRDTPALSLRQSLFSGFA